MNEDPQGKINKILQQEPKGMDLQNAQERSKPDGPRIADAKPQVVQPDTANPSLPGEVSPQEKRGFKAWLKDAVSSKVDGQMNSMMNGPRQAEGSPDTGSPGVDKSPKAPGTKTPQPTQRTPEVPNTKGPNAKAPGLPKLPTAKLPNFKRPF